MNLYQLINILIYLLLRFLIMDLVFFHRLLKIFIIYYFYLHHVIFYLSLMQEYVIKLLIVVALLHMILLFIFNNFIRKLINFMGGRVRCLFIDLCLTFIGMYLKLVVEVNIHDLRLCFCLCFRNHVKILFYEYLRLVLCYLSDDQHNYDQYQT